MLERGTRNTLLAMEPKPNANEDPTINTSSWSHNACYPQSAKTLFLCPAAIAKSNCEDNPVKRIMEIGAVVNFQEISKWVCIGAGVLVVA